MTQKFISIENSYAECITERVYLEIKKEKENGYTLQHFEIKIVEGECNRAWAFLLFEKEVNPMYKKCFMCEGARAMMRQSNE